MTVCSDMLELILGPINIVNRPKDAAAISVVTETTDTKEDESHQSDVSIACTAMSCSIEDNKDAKVSSSSSSTLVRMDTISGETSDKGNNKIIVETKANIEHSILLLIKISL